jgi:hypothetical protein
VGLIWSLRHFGGMEIPVSLGWDCPGHGGCGWRWRATVGGVVPEMWRCLGRGLGEPICGVCRGAGGGGWWWSVALGGLGE